MSDLLEDTCKFDHIDKLKGDTRTKMLHASSKLQEDLNDALMDEYNTNLCSVARWLKEGKFTEAEAIEVIYKTEGHRSPVDDEIERAVGTVYASEGKPKSKWPQPKKRTPAEVRNALKSRGIGTMSEAELIVELGGTPACDGVGDFIRRFYKDVKLPIYVGSQQYGEIAPVEGWAERADEIHRKGYEQIICNPMKRIPTADELKLMEYDSKGEPVVNKKTGRHKRKYAAGGRHLDFASDTLDVVTFECDTLPAEDQFAIIAYLAKYLPLLSIVDSANKSHHATFSAQGVPKKHVYELRQTLVNLGADKGVLAPVSLHRLGCVQRKGKGLQRVLYLNGDARHESVDKDKLAELMRETGDDPAGVPANVFRFPLVGWVTTFPPKSSSQ